MVQDDRLLDAFSVIICPFTTDPSEAPIMRLSVEPSPGNALRSISQLMIDKLTAVPKSKLGSVIGRLEDADTMRLNRAIVVFLGLAGP